MCEWITKALITLIGAENIDKIIKSSSKYVEFFFNVQRMFCDFMYMF